MDRKIVLLFSSLIIIGGLVTLFLVNKNNLTPQRELTPENDLVSGDDYTHIFHEEAIVNRIMDNEKIMVTIEQTAETAEFFEKEQLVLNCPDGFSNIEVSDTIIFYFFLDNVNGDEIRVERIKKI